MLNVENMCLISPGTKSKTNVLSGLLFTGLTKLSVDIHNKNDFRFLSLCSFIPIPMSIVSQTKRWVYLRREADVQPGPQG